MQFVRTEIPDIVIVEPRVFGDARGFFLETFQSRRYAAEGITNPFVQDNLSRAACCAACISRILRRRESW
jgi:dTDP-4-dehydrorhamnose 3,5-epimerase